MCEVLEHLNFNPLPVIQEINRIMKKNGAIYVSMPNPASLPNRLKLIRGESIHNPVIDFSNQLGAEGNMIVGLHWREYTAAETKEMLETMGFSLVEQKYYSAFHYTKKNPLKEIFKKTIRALLTSAIIRDALYECLFDSQRDNSLKETQIAVAVKKDSAQRTFYFTDATKNR